MNATSTFLCRHGIDPYIRGFRQSYFKHSDLGYFVDLRPIGSTVHLWTAFVGLVIIQQSIRLLSADFTELLTGQFSLTPASRSIKGAVSGRYPIIPPLGLLVLLTSEIFVLLLVPDFVLQPRRLCSGTSRTDIHIVSGPDCFFLFFNFHPVDIRNLAFYKLDCFHLIHRLNMHDWRWDSYQYPEILQASYL